MPDDANTEVPKKPELPVPMRDWNLLNLIDLANRLEAGFPVTIVCGGAVITGDLVSVREYFRLFGELLSGPFEPHNQEAADAIRKQFEGVGDEIRAEIEEEESGAREPTLPSFIHLRNAQFVAGNAMLPTNGMLWRGKLSHVSGFALDRFTVSR